MKARVEIEAGICGLKTRAQAASEDGQNVTFDVKTACSKIGQFASAIGAKGPIDAYQEISANGPAVILTAARENLTGCCSGCVVPVGFYKAMQVAAGLALPKDITLTLTKEE